ncbi:hypothetical protein ACROYT_G026537 [Oculina patagonica]
MDNISSSSFTNITNKLVNISKEVKARNVIYEVTFIINVIINSIACPLTVLLNVLVIMAVKRRPRLQSNTNILLACLAATDVFTGLVTQPLFLLDKMFEFLGMTKFETQFYFFWAFSLRVLTVCSCLHLTLVTCERLIAIKFTMRYPYLVTGRNIKVAVIAAWIFSLFNGTSRINDGCTVRPVKTSVAAKQASKMLVLLWSLGLLYTAIITSTLSRTVKGQVMQLMTMVMITFTLSGTVLASSSMEDLLHHLPLDSSAQRVRDNGREKTTKTTEQHQHLAGLFSDN